MAAKRIKTDDHERFSDDWTAKYLFVFTDKPVCLVCNSNVAATKKYNLECHYKTHAAIAKQYPQDSQLRKDWIANVRNQLITRQQMFTVPNDTLRD
jgi:hypothetical protein